MVSNDTVVIHDGASLQAWRRRLRSIASPRRLPVVDFRFPELAPGQNRRFSILAAGYRRACGCASGGFLMTFTVVTMVVSYFLSGKALADITLREIVTFVGITALAALLGKLAGLLWARWRLLKLAITAQRAITRARSSAR